MLQTQNICQNKKSDLHFCKSLVLALRIFPASSKYCPAVKKQPGGPQGSAACGGVKRPQRLGSCLPWREQSEAGRLSSNPVCFSRYTLLSNIKKSDLHFCKSLVLALPIFPARARIVLP